MTNNDDLRTRAVEAAEEHYGPLHEHVDDAAMRISKAGRRVGFVAGFLAHAAQQSNLAPNPASPKHEPHSASDAWFDGTVTVTQQPTREQIARAIYNADGFHAADTWDTDTQMIYLHRADAVLALFEGDESDE